MKTTEEFIQEHLYDDVHALSLNSTYCAEIDMNFAVKQILGYQKTASKIPSWKGIKTLLFPARLSLEQCSSEAAAQHKASMLHGNTFIDLTGGFGVDCAFISKNFERVHYVERQEDLCRIAKHNFKALGLSNIEVHKADAVEFMQNFNKAIDVVYIDPARRDAAGRKMIGLSDCTPDVTKIIDLLIKKSKLILIKLSPMADITSIRKSLPNISQIQVVSIDNECKELLIIIKQKQTEHPKLTAIDLHRNGQKQMFSFFIHQEQKSVCDFAEIPHRFLYEPSAAILKSGAFRTTALRFGILKLHPNTHLYTSDKLIPDFQGRRFVVERFFTYSKKTLKQELHALSAAQIATRNFPDSAESLRKKFKIKESKDTVLFACTIANENKIMLLCRKIE